MSLQAEYEYLCTGSWAAEDSEECPCHGHGWLLSDLDTTHKCPIHFKGQLHGDEIENLIENGATEEAIEKIQEKAFKDWQEKTQKVYTAPLVHSHIEPMPCNFVAFDPNDDIPF